MELTLSLYPKEFIIFCEMVKHDKTIQKILSGRSDSNIKFKDAKNLLIHLGFDMRIKGSHHIFRKEGIKELINIQKDGN